MSLMQEVSSWNKVIITLTSSITTLATSENTGYPDGGFLTSIYLQHSLLEL